VTADAGGAARPRRTSVYVDGFGHVNPIPAACRIGDLIYSGVITGRDPETGRPPETLDGQCAQMFRHLRDIVAAAGASAADIIKVTVWLRDPGDRTALNRAWTALFPDPADRPARHTMGGDLGDGLLAQCDFVAVAPTSTPDRTEAARTTEGDDLT
jgi:2-iminobutanoate/2-iminopropanoate deaminase